MMKDPKKADVAIISGQARHEIDGVGSQSSIMSEGQTQWSQVIGWPRRQIRHGNKPIDLARIAFSLW